LVRSTLDAGAPQAGAGDHTVGVTTPGDDTLAANKALVRRIYEDGYDRGDASVFESLYAPDFDHHSKVIHDVGPAGPGEAESMRRFRAAIPDVRFRVMDQLAEGDMVATRLHITGHPVGGYGPVSADDAVFDVHAMVLFRVEDGLAAEEWLFVDGGMPPPDAGGQAA
jgi:predicted ester cyclase